MALLNMAMFLGIALMQWVSGAAATLAGTWHADPYSVALGTVAAMLTLGAATFVWLPAPRTDTPAR
jgi:hypothetical protein